MSSESRGNSDLVASAIERLTGERPAELSLVARALSGGLSARSVLLIRGAYGDRRGRRRSFRWVIKHLDGIAIRERQIYEQLVVPYAAAFSPALIGAFELSPQRSVLVLEAVPTRSWPWRGASSVQLALERLASFHVSTTTAVDSPALKEWSYENALEASAQGTYEAVLSCRSRPELSALSKAAPATRRIVSMLRAWRQALHGCGPFRRCVLHGDVHPGNVLVRRERRGQGEPVFIDWERARVGSPLEDASSWLHSLGFWEPEVRRRHDSLFGAYLSAIGLERKLTSEIRAAYWMAGACNALAGALRYHLVVAQDHQVNQRQRGVSARAAFAWLRVLRRADAFWS